MSIHGVGTPGIPAWPRGPEPTREPGDASQAERGGAPAPQAEPRTGAKGVAPVMPETAPESTERVPDGVDAELWSVLTTEERAHFAKFAAMGGVTYGPNAKGPSRPMVQGHRLDLRI